MMKSLMVTWCSWCYFLTKNNGSVGWQNGAVVVDKRKLCCVVTMKKKNGAVVDKRKLCCVVTMKKKKNGAVVVDKRKLCCVVTMKKNGAVVVDKRKWGMRIGATC